MNEETRRRAAVEHLELALQRLRWAAEELRCDAAALATTLRLSLLREKLARECRDLAGASDTPGPERQPLAVRVPIHASSGDCVQWPIARVTVGGTEVQCYHSGAFLGFELDGLHWLVPLVPVVQDLVAAVAPIRIGIAPAEAATAVPAPNGTRSAP